MGLMYKGRGVPYPKNCLLPVVTWQYHVTSCCAGVPSMSPRCMTKL